MHSKSQSTKSAPNTILKDARVNLNSNDNNIKNVLGSTNDNSKDLQLG